ncbi:hypothetical protein Tco_1192563 [Tanacetum coccineum]
MTTIAKNMIVAGAENRPPMLDKSMYNSWESRMWLYIKGKKNGIMMLEYIENGPLVYLTIEEDGKICEKKYAEFTEQEKLQDDRDVQETIILQGLRPDVYSLVNHCKAAKDIWDVVKLLMQCTELSYQECECKLYNEFDKFTSVSARMLRERYLDPLALVAHHETQSHSIQYPQQLSLTPQQAHSSQPYLSTYEASHHPQQYQHPFQTQLNYSPPSVPQNAYHIPPISQQPQVEFPQLELGFVVPSFRPGDDLIACLNKAMEFITSSNPRNQATIQDGRVTVQQVQGDMVRVLLGEGHMARHCVNHKDSNQEHHPEVGEDKIRT